MKHLPSLSTALLVLLTFALWCCGQSNAPHDQAVVTTKSAVLDTCMKAAIDTTTARQEQALWLNKRNTINALVTKYGNPADTIFLAKSYNIRKCDLLGMLKALSDGPAIRPDSIIASLAIRNNLPTLIFHDVDLATGQEVYYDFTRPCPPGHCGDKKKGMRE